jgi:signal transduction histidine kinase
MPSQRDFVMPAAIALVAAGAVVLLWQGLRYDHERGVANVAEATSYATRSELARRLIDQFATFDALARFWASSSEDAELGGDVDAPVDSIRFEGIETLAWRGTDGQRFLARNSTSGLRYVPTEAEWAPVAPLFASAPEISAPTTVGPSVDSDGHAVFRYYVPARGPSHSGMLAAVIDARDLLEALLVDESLGYAIRVTCCNGVELYRRGVSDDELPGAWTRDGWITPAPGIRWNVSNRPSPDLADDLNTSAADSVLVVGLALALLLGGLVFETRRANDRASAANDAERRVRKLNRELEERVLARTQRLRDALADMNTVNLAVAHDLRSPLGAISLSVGQMRETAPDADAAERCDRVGRGVQRMKGILDRLLGYSRSAFDSELEEVDMRALVEQVLDEQSVPAAKVSLGELPSARADRVITHILLRNLVANAVKHGQGRRGLALEIGSRIAESGETAYFVRDEGPGLDPRLADQLFKPVTNRPADSSGGGLGLGLAICARAAERHGGRIWVESEPGRGATFLFTLGVSPTRATPVVSD